MTNNRKVMGDKANSFWLNVLARVTVAAVFSASIGLVVTSLI
jgi:Mn2+/Fe2+ NRAMP family transporter